MTLPERLAAPVPGWTARADVVVVGSGVAGLTTALRLRGTGSVLVVTKQALSAGSTAWAQGGIAAALGPGDTPEQHLRDTLDAGAGLCDADAVRVLVTEGPGAVRELAALGAVLDRTPAGDLSLTREGGHHRDRVAHAGGDATGAEVERALVAAVRAAPDIEVLEHALALDVVPGVDGGVAGVTVHVSGASSSGTGSGVGTVLCRALVLASGGLGQLFSATTNPSVSTADGAALALRAGAVLRDLEFVQFHPTVLWLGDGARGQQPLVSEALRGEGAVLLDVTGRRYLLGRHPLADLAPRDVVARETVRRMSETGSEHVWLDARDLGDAAWFQRRFPTVWAGCRAHGIDPTTDLVPVVPASHYASGGVVSDLHGRTSVPGLLACGEVACTGVHGGNRLASNSLLEGLVLGRRVAAQLAEALPPWQAPAPDPRTPGLVPAAARRPIQRTMSAHAGVLRSREGLLVAAAELAALAPEDRREPVPREASDAVAAWETTNLHTVGTALARAALVREETRGSHWRQDHPESDPAWVRHLDVTLARGRLRIATTARSELTGSPA